MNFIYRWRSKRIHTAVSSRCRFGQGDLLDTRLQFGGPTLSYRVNSKSLKQKNLFCSIFNLVFNLFYHFNKTHTEHLSRHTISGLKQSMNFYSCISVINLQK